MIARFEEFEEMVILEQINGRYCRYNHKEGDMFTKDNAQENGEIEKRVIEEIDKREVKLSVIDAEDYLALLHELYGKIKQEFPKIKEDRVLRRVRKSMMQRYGEEMRGDEDEMV